MAVAKFRTKIFNTALEVQAFVTVDADVASVISVVFDAASGKYVLFYMTP